MKRAWGIAVTILRGGVIASCATRLGADGDSELAAASSGSGGAGVSSSSAGTGGDPAPSTSTSVSVSSSSSDSSSASSGGAGGGVVGPVSWHRYSFDMKTSTWSSTLLSSDWTGSNAPPSSGIIAACHLISFDKLLVFTAAGMLYIQDSGVWLPPKLTHFVFPDLAEPAMIADLYHLPSELNMPPMVMPLTEQLVIVDVLPTIWTYQFDSSNTISVGVQNTIPPPDKANQPPWDTVRVQWAFNIWNKSKAGTPDVYATWGAFGDGYVYERLYNDTWLKWPVESSPLWV